MNNRIDSVMRLPESSQLSHRYIIGSDTLLDARPWVRLGLADNLTLPIGGEVAVPAILDTGFDGDVAMSLEHLSSFLCSPTQEFAISHEAPRADRPENRFRDHDRGYFFVMQMCYCLFPFDMKDGGETYETGICPRPHVWLDVLVFVNEHQKTQIEASWNDEVPFAIWLPNLFQAGRGRAKGDARPSLPIIGVKAMRTFGLKLQVNVDGYVLTSPNFPLLEAAQPN
jgi:hypothetical protein